MSEDTGPFVIGIDGNTNSILLFGPSENTVFEEYDNKDHSFNQAKEVWKDTYEVSDERYSTEPHSAEIKAVTEDDGQLLITCVINGETVSLETNNVYIDN